MRKAKSARVRNFAVAYLNVLIDDADQDELTAALERLASLTGGRKLVEKVELNAACLFRALCPRGNPELRIVATLLRSMGVRLALQPLSEGTRNQLLRERHEARLEEAAAAVSRLSDLAV
jgi:DNA-binding phage protein